MRYAVISLTALGLALAACGSTDEKRAASGGLTGAGVGALVGGPVGALVGAGVGAAGGTALDEGVEKKAERGVDRVQDRLDRRDDRAMASGSGATRSDMTSGSGASSRTGSASKAEIRQAQEALRSKGLYTGPIDGVAGPKTKQAVREFQRREGIQETAMLDRTTMQRLGSGSSSMRSGSDTRTGTATTGSARTGSSGTAATGSGSAMPNTAPAAQAGSGQQAGGTAGGGTTGPTGMGGAGGSSGSGTR